VSIASISPSNPYVWLNPPAMAQAVSEVAAAMEAANPQAAGVYRNGAQAFSDEVDSGGIDYESTLSVCPRTAIFTADGAFSAMARDYGLQDHLLGTQTTPDTATVAALAGQVRASGATTVFSEPWVSSATVTAVAAAAGVKVRSLDTLTGPPPAGWPAGANYVNLMESNLGTLASALSCPDESTEP
jgi:zinc transport system substrate-binding protein